MDSLHIIPGKGLSGYFSLDMSILKALKKLRTFNIKHPGIHLIEESSTKRIIIDIPENHIKLVFDENYQILLIIEIDCRDNNFSKLPIMYKAKMYKNYNDILSALDAPYKLLSNEENINIEQYNGLSVLIKDNSLLKIFIHKNNSLPLYRNNLKA